MRNKKPFLFFFSMLISFSVKAQYSLNEADQTFEPFQSDKTNDLYDQAYHKKINFKLSGTVYNKKTRKPLSHAIVTLYKTDGSALKVITNEQGQFKFNLEKKADYLLTGEKTNYIGDGTSLTTFGRKVSTEIKKDLCLEAIKSIH